MSSMKQLADITPEEADDWWDELDRRSVDAEVFATARLKSEYAVARLDLFTSGESAKAIAYFNTKADRLSALENGFQERAEEMVNGSVFAAQLPFRADAHLAVDSIEEMKDRGDTFGAPFGWR